MGTATSLAVFATVWGYISKKTSILGPEAVMGYLIPTIPGAEKIIGIAGTRNTGRAWQKWSSSENLGQLDCEERTIRKASGGVRR